MIMRKSYLLGLLLFLVFSDAQAKRQPKEAIKAAMRAAESEDIFRSATIGCYAVNLTQGKVIGNVNATKSIIPASTLKLLTTAAALETLGKDFRFKTVIQYDGEIDEAGTLYGNIYIKGGGDPTLGSPNFQDHYYQPHFIDTWVQAIQAKGIKKITGAVIGDAEIYEDFIIPGGWAVGDLGEYYGAAVSGLSIFDNIYNITLQASEEGEKASLIDIAPSLPEEVKTILKVKGADIDHQKVDVLGLPDHPARIVQGEIPCDSRAIVLQSTNPDPAYWAASFLHQELCKKDVEVAQLPNTVRRMATPAISRQDLCTIFSPPLSEIISVISHKSMNNYAEHVLKQLSIEAGGPGDISSGIRTLKQFWADQGIDTTGMLLRDGSGLSRNNAITPKQLVEVLRYMRNSDNFEFFYTSLPIAGETGNLIHLFKTLPLRGNVRAKSGTLGNIRGFAGYCTNRHGDEIAFALIVNYYDGPRSSAEELIEKILEAFVSSKK